MKAKRILTSILAFTLGFSAVFVSAPQPPTVEAASNYNITYQLPPNPEKYLFLNVQMVSISNPQVVAMKRAYTRENYLVDMDTGGSYYMKTQYRDNINFITSKKGFLWNLYHFIAILPPSYPSNINLDDLDRQIEATEEYSEEGRELRVTRAQIEMNARLQPLINAGYVKAEEIDDGTATKEFVATVLYRMFGGVRPYHGGIDLKDSNETAVRWAVEVGLPGFDTDSQGYVHPETTLQLGDYTEEYGYDRLFHFITLILPGKKTTSGWEYYQVKLRSGMVPMRTQDIVQVDGKPLKVYDIYQVMDTKEFQAASRKVAQYATPRFAQMLDQARKDARKPRVWSWSREVVNNPKFVKLVNTYRKNKNSKNLNAIYQAVRNHYNLSIQQDSIANIKSVLDHVN